MHIYICIKTKTKSYALNAAAFSNKIPSQTALGFFYMISELISHWSTLFSSQCQNILSYHSYVDTSWGVSAQAFAVAGTSTCAWVRNVLSGLSTSFGRLELDQRTILMF